MTAVLLDTHAWVWSIIGSHNLTGAAVEALTEADVVLVSPVSLYEIGLKHRLGKWPEVGAAVPLLMGQLAKGEVQAIQPDAALFLMAAELDWDHRDPFDRVIAASALTAQADLVSADRSFSMPGAPGVNRVW